MNAEQKEAYSLTTEQHESLDRHFNKHGFGAIRAGVDDTDHICFFCKECNQRLTVKKVLTRRIQDKTKSRKCTWIYMSCDDHGEVGWLKFYWDGSGHEWCRHRTHKTPKIENGGSA